MSKKLIKGLWKAETNKIKGSLPKMRKNLANLMETPSFVLENGQISQVAEKDIEYLCEIVPSSLWEEVKLPLIFQKKKQQYNLLGDKLEKWVVEKILELTTNSPYLLRIFSPRDYYFVYHYQQVQKKIPSLVFLTFTIKDDS